MISTDSLARIAIDIQLGISHQDRFHRLIQSIRSLLNSDASALLRYEGGQFIPLAIDGLMQDVLGRRFAIKEHPRMEAIARAGDVVRFPADSSLPDPYDGLIPDHAEFKVHACVGLPLFSDQVLIGALTIDGMNPAQFDDISDEELRLIGALAAAALSNSLLLERLARQSSEPLIPSTPTGADRFEIIGHSQAMQQLKHEVDIVANTDLNVLILGETGVGKELIAKAVHLGSPRTDRKLVYLNCAALPESVAESELFGHVKGAFTGAIHNRAGKFELADKGTLFLDEVGELSLSLQAKLLRVIQYGDLQRIGDDTPLKVNVRVLAATNRDLKKAVINGEFRSDLYHRLSVFPIHVPALRDREDDISLLAGYFCECCRVSMGLEQLRIQPQALHLLKGYGWPGNVRELEHAIHRGAVLARAEQRSSVLTLATHHFSIAIPPMPQSGISPTENIDDFATNQMGLRASTDAFQSALITKVLADHNDNWAATARALDIDCGNLHRLAKRLGLK
ncbi:MULTISPECIES: nitric oxide reductase transcriptional regulator NorR [Aeromonas]|uniref:nitric oxide reductase transcriptional regulator NorR n=1 Tax=Aeromonas TaxID=642 RepID=UPI00111774C6|nr:nitric oxide reductase transcriptional regulator NorR [Aeromonas veronii]ELV7510233.1 nitric oxide reductase transcriptional regulator NorR [Aeromonas veronii]MCF5718846.1 nitric oxide reductase transcriptional regulator NorR [Aeromonas veronii]TNI30422.1 nitric oxide reductase transcription regulator [Aeromonas veronii]